MKVLLETKGISFLLGVVLLGNLNAAVIDIRTEDYLGRVVIEKRDFVIISPFHSLSGSSIPNITTCESKGCRENFISKMKHLYRTNGISVITIK